MENATRITVPNKNESVGKRIKLGILAKGMSLAEYARRTGKSTQQINGWVNEGKQCSWDEMSDISDITGIPVDWYLNGYRRFLTIEQQDAIRAAYTKALAKEPVYEHIRIE